MGLALYSPAVALVAGAGAAALGASGWAWVIVIVLALLVCLAAHLMVVWRRPCRWRRHD